jgi:hypothetical protein
MTTTKKLGPPGSEIDVDAFLFDSVNITPEAIDEEFVRLPADLAYWNALYARAHKAHLMAKLDAERIESGLFLETRETLLSEWRVAKAGRETNVDTIKARMQADPRYYNSKLAELEAEVERTRLRGVVSALEAKKDMVQSYGAKLRSEMTDPLLRAAVRAHSA